MDLDQIKYLDEMSELFERVRLKFEKERPIDRIFVISIWTDPDAAASSVSLESRSHSDMFTGTPGVPNDSPADFEYRDFSECEHSSFPKFWEENTSGACWGELEPALVAAANNAIRLFEKMPLEPDAVLGVNSSRDWFDRRWALNSSAD